jgi:catecholate siderophore receptor
MRFLPNGANNDMKATVAAAYVQNQLRPADWLEIVAGLRFDRFAMDIDNLNNGQSFGRTDQLWSPRLGLILKPLQNLSLYTSYSRSYLPQAATSSTRWPPTPRRSSPSASTITKRA